MAVDEQRPDPPLASPNEPEGLAPDYDEAGQPSFDYVRDRIEGRFATSLGATELAVETPQASSLQEQFEQREKVAEDKVAKIRKSLHESPRDTDDTDDAR